MLKKNKPPSNRGKTQFIMRKCKNENRQETTLNGRKNIKTDINNEEKLAKKKHTNVTKQCEKQRHKNRNHAQKNVENYTNVGKQHKKQRLTQKC